MRLCGAVGIHYRRRGGCTRPGDGEVSDDLVNRAFDPDGPDRLSWPGLIYVRVRPTWLRYSDYSRDPVEIVELGAEELRERSGA